MSGIKPGDYLIIDFGHNDGSPINTGRARGSLKGTGEESRNVIMERNGSTETIYTFGTYLRKYIRQAIAKGAIVIVTSHTPGNWWKDDNVTRCDLTYGKWSKEVAEQEDVFFIDLNERTACKLEQNGKEKAAGYFVDSVHNTEEGAKMNSESVIEGIRELKECSLNDYIK